MKPFTSPREANEWWMKNAKGREIGVLMFWDGELGTQRREIKRYGKSGQWVLGFPEVR